MATTKVLLTGVGGFIGSHLAREFLERGYSVRGTVRDASNKVKNGHLTKLPGADERLEIVSADLMSPGSFDEHVPGCDWVCHAAAAVRFAAKNPQQDIVDPAIDGTRNLLSRNSLNTLAFGSFTFVGSTSGALYRSTNGDSWEGPFTVGAGTIRSLSFGALPVGR